MAEPKIALPPQPKPELVSNLPPPVTVADFAIATLEAKKGARIDVDTSTLLTRRAAAATASGR